MPNERYGADNGQDERVKNQYRAAICAKWDISRPAFDPDVERPDAKKHR